MRMPTFASPKIAAFRQNGSSFGRVEIQQGCCSTEELQHGLSGATEGGHKYKAPSFMFSASRSRIDWRVLHGVDVRKLVSDVANSGNDKDKIQGREHELSEIVCNCFISWIGRGILDVD